MSENAVDPYERGRRRGTVETLAAILDLLRAGGDWQQIGQLRDLAREAEHDPAEFDMDGLLAELTNQRICEVTA